MQRLSILSAGLCVLVEAHAAPGFACLQDCYRGGYDRGYCVTICESQQGGGVLEQPGLPKNPAFDQLRQAAPQQRPLPAVADPECMKDCQKRGYNYMLCHKRCSYSLPGH
jgi:hypothetical protein